MLARLLIDAGEGMSRRRRVGLGRESARKGISLRRFPLGPR